MTEGEMVGWHHQPDGHEFEQAPGVGDGQGGLVGCSPWGRKESDTTERLFHLVHFRIFLGPRVGFVDPQGLENSKTCSLSYLKCCLTCCACRQAWNPSSVQAGEKPVRSLFCF